MTSRFVFVATGECCCADILMTCWGIRGILKVKVKESVLAEIKEIVWAVWVIANNF